MHQDQRIGLALGVLLIGASAAFFFRNETLERPKSPQLQHAEQLDERIADKATRPYLQGIEAVESNGKRLRSVSNRQNEEAGDDADHSSYWSPSVRKPRANFTELESDVQELDPIPVPSDGMRTHGLTQTDGGQEKKDPKSEETSADNHIVQKGETLSSISAKRLGNPGRFLEIFEANRDQLKDANDLKQGMVLRLPEQRGEASKSLASQGRRLPGSSSSLEPTSRGEGSVPSSISRPSSAPQGEIDEQLTRSDSAQPQAEHRTDSTTGESSSRKFVAARRFTPPARPRQ